MAGRGRGRGRGRPLTLGQELLRSSAEECGLDSRNLRSLQDVTRPPFYPEILLHSSGDQAKLAVEQQLKLQKQQQQQQQQQGKGGGANIKSDPDAGGGGEEEPTKKPIAGVKRTAQTVFLISKTWELHHRLRNSAHYVRPTKDVPDVVRYSDLHKKHKTDNSDNKKKKKKEDHHHEEEDREQQQQQHDASMVLANCLGGRTYTEVGRFVPEELVSGQKRRTDELMLLYGNDDGLFGTTNGKLNFDDLAKKERINRIRERIEGTNAAAGTTGEGGNESDTNLDNLQDDEESEPDDYGKDYYESEDDNEDDGDNEPTFS